MLRLPDLAASVLSVTPNISDNILFIRLGNPLKLSTLVLPSFSFQKSCIVCLACSYLLLLVSSDDAFLFSLNATYSGELSSKLLVDDPSAAMLVSESAPLDIPAACPITPSRSALSLRRNPPLWNIISSISLKTVSPSLFIVIGLNSLIV